MQNIRIKLQMVLAAVEGKNYLEASKAMLQVAEYCEQMYFGQPDDVVEQSKYYVDRIKMCADAVLVDPDAAVFRFRELCTMYAVKVLVPWISQGSLELDRDEKVSRLYSS